jgi:hypothetical protein
LRPVVTESRTGQIRPDLEQLGLELVAPGPVQRRRSDRQQTLDASDPANADGRHSKISGNRK